MPVPITQGKDFNFFRKITVSDGYFFHNANNDADVCFNFRGQVSFSLVNEGAGVVQYSFNGQVVHGDMTPGTPTQAIFFDNRRVTKIWFRLISGAASVIRVESWAAA